MSKYKIIFISAIIFILVVLGALLAVYQYYQSKQELVSYFHIENPIIFQQQVSPHSYVMDDGLIYFPFDFIKENIDSGITYDENSQSVIIISNENILRFPVEKLEKFVNEEPFEIEAETFISENGKHYVELTQLENIYPLSYQVDQEYGTVLLFQDGEIRQKGTISNTASKKELRLKTETTYFSNYYNTLHAGEEVYIESEHDDFYYVRQKNGIAGFIKKQIVENIETETFEITRDEPFQPLTLPSGLINLTWEAVYTKNPDVHKLPQLPGINVVSPTWFHIDSVDGHIKSLASMTYVQWAKDRGYEIWALFSNDFDPELTHQVLQSYEIRQKMIRQLLQYSEMYDLDGINIDFENVYLKDKDLVTQFARELTALAHQAGLIVSMDITFLSSSEMWSMFYDRQKLATIVDYLIVMAYDEHWASSPVAGSVASFPWVKENVEKLLEIIPSERLILGIPTYTRIWKEQETEGGNIEVSSKALSMAAVNEWLIEHNVTPSYDEVSGQDYAEYYDQSDKATHKIWIENSKSIYKRAQLVHEYGLAGVATWNRYFANDESWEALQKSLNKE